MLLHFSRTINQNTHNESECSTVSMAPGQNGMLQPEEPPPALKRSMGVHQSGVLESLGLGSEFRAAGLENCSFGWLIEFGMWGLDSFGRACHQQAANLKKPTNPKDPSIPQVPKTPLVAGHLAPRIPGERDGSVPPTRSKATLTYCFGFGVGGN